MKLNKFLIIIILFILTIGVVSAAENTTQDTISLESNSEDALSDASYFDDDFYVSVNENYTQDKDDWQSHGIVYISSYSQKNGTFKVYVDDNEKQNYTLTNGYFAVENTEYGTYNRYFQSIYPNDLGIVDCGKYNIKVKFDTNTLIDTSVNMNEKDDFDIWLQNPYYCEEEYWSSPSFIVIDSIHQNSGLLEIFVDGVCKISYPVVNGEFPEIPDCSNRSRYVAPSDLLSGYGTFGIQINFTENGVTKCLRNESVVVAEFEPTVDPKLEVYLDLYTVNLPADNIAHIYLPREATGNLTVSYNNVNNEVITYSKGYGEYYIYAWNLNHLGVNTLTFKYVGDDFGTLTTSVDCVVVPSIVAPSFVSVGEEFKISMTTHEWVNGNFNVYDYNDGKKGDLLASARISNRVSSVSLSSDVFGLNKYYLEFDYPGGDYPLIQEIYVVENSENISVNVPSSVSVGSGVVVNITAPATPFNFAYISVDGVNRGFYSMENGSVVETILGLEKGYHNLSVQYNDGYYSDGKLVGDVYSNTFTVDVDEKDDFDIWLQNPYYCEEEYWSSPSFIVIDSIHQNSGLLEIFVDGVCKISYPVVNGEFPEIPDCRNKSRYVAPSDLLSGYGTFRIQINFTENGVTKCLRDESVVVAEFEPTVDPKLEVYLDLYTVNLPADNIAHIYLPREATGNLTVSYNNVNKEVITYSKGHGEYYIHAWNLNHLGVNTLTFKYVGDDFGTLTTSVDCVVVPSIVAPSFVSVGEEFKISMTTHNWVNGNFNVYDYNDGKKGDLLASGRISNGVSSVSLSSDVFGLNKYYLEFDYPSGDYPLIQEIYVVKNSENISVNVPSSVSVGSGVVVNITAPATPFNFAYISVDGVNRGFYSMENGSVVETILGLEKGYHNLSVQYNDGYYSDGKLVGDVYSNTFNVCVGLKTNIVAPQVNTVYNVVKNLVITLKDSNNDVLPAKTLTIKLNGVTYTRTTNNNGQVIMSISLPAKTYTANINFAGDDTYLKSSNNVKIVVKKATPKITAKAKTFKVKTKIKKFTATLKDNKGRVMKKANLYLKVKGKTYKATTNAKGKATFKITKLNKKGTYSAKITFKANSNYNAATKTVKIKVK